MTEARVLEPMRFPPRRERHRRGAHLPAERFCCVSSHRTLARASLLKAGGSLRTGALRRGRRVDEDETGKRARRLRVVAPRSRLSETNVLVRACERERSSRRNRHTARDTRRVRFRDRSFRRVAFRETRNVALHAPHALARTSSTNCPSLPSGPPFPSTRCSPVAILL